jgi:hypothetical protein
MATVAIKARNVAPSGVFDGAILISLAVLEK